MPDEQPNSITPPTAVGPVVQQAFTEYRQGARPCAGDSHVKDTVFALKELIVWSGTHITKQTHYDETNYAKNYRHTKEGVVHFAWGRVVGIREGFTEEVTSELALEDPEFFREKKTEGMASLRRRCRMVPVSSWEGELFSVVQSMRKGEHRSRRS